MSFTEGKPILAFMQNQWFKDAETVKTIFEKYPDMRQNLVSRFLFAGCRSGKVLEANLGRDLCNKIIWEECSKEIGSEASSVFPADLVHMEEIFSKFKTQLKAVVCFGSVAKAGWDKLNVDKNDVHYFYAPHPTNRDILSTQFAIKLLRQEFNKLI